ncbi:hypothetical protein ALC62_09825 [Cyphomyrmex costatus]|uniref:Uncharacterized protein n=1 Tax=Cyphomyrmex costatus TaxID=456900 RepID=A0A195CHB8_9HYME|nr:hypothetical protein ALC62_09825 [Cyphomyrmex costatus]
MRIFVTRRIHGGIFSRMPVIRLDPAEGSVSSCEFLTRYTRARYTQIVRRSCLITGIVVTGEQPANSRRRETLIFIVPYAGRPAKTPGDSQS